MVVSIVPPLTSEPKKDSSTTALSHVGHSARIGSIRIHFRQRRGTIVGPVLFCHKHDGKIQKTYRDIVGISGSWKVPELNRGFKVKII